ncbi:MAG: GNAT family N-acetyltransferase [Planctomycetota bacterium]|jgi:CelD/BcsL family acetyltransferase involved in cellulose biosynthesis
MDKEKSLRKIEPGTDTNAKKGVQVKVYHSFEKLQSIQRQWDEFVESVGSEIFLTYDWCRVWWKYYGKNRKLRIFVFRSDNELVGIVPLFLEKIWLGPVFVRTVKIVGSDFTIAHFSLPIHDKYINKVIVKLFESLSEDKWSIMSISPIAGIYAHYDLLKVVLEKLLGHSHYLLDGDNDVQTYFQLPDSWQEYLKALSRTMRKHVKNNFKRLQRVLGKDKTIITHFASSENLEQFFDGFVDMHQRRWVEAGMPGHFRDWPASYEFHREVAGEQLKHNRLRLLEVKANKCILGYMYAYKFGDRYLEFLDARSQAEELESTSLGQIVFYEEVKKAIEENISYIDSMRGKYEYKLWMCGKLAPFRNLYIIPRKPFTVVCVKLFMLFAWFLNLFYYRIWYKRIASKLPLKRRGLWKIWIRTCCFV